MENTTTTFAAPTTTSDAISFGGNQPVQFSKAQPWEMPTKSFTPKPAERHNRRIMKDANYQQGSYQPIED